MVATIAVIWKDRLLMGRRRDNGRETTPGGHGEAGETPLQAAVRELREESGISASEAQLKPIGDKAVPERKLHVYAFRYDVGERPPTSMRHDPDGEVHRWRWVDISRHTLPRNVESNLHVPLERNVLLKALGVKAMEKTAFWNGFDKQAMMPSLNPLSAAVAGGKALATKAVGLAKANPKTALGLGAAGAVGTGAMLGRATAPQR